MTDTLAASSLAVARSVLLVAALVQGGCSPATPVGADVASVNAPISSTAPTHTALAASSSVAVAAPEAEPSAAAPAPPIAPELRPAEWAQPLSLAGLPNLYQVTAQLYRSAQPTAAGMKQLPPLGIRTVVNLRSVHSDRPRLGVLPLGYEHISMKAWHAEDEDIVELLKLLTDPQRQPVLVHCKHGADRTGLAVAVYRVAVQGWTKDEAIREMTQGGFGFHTIWQNLVDYLRQLDVPRIRREAGIE